MDRYIHNENLALLKKRLEEPQTAKLKLLAEEQAKDGDASKNTHEGI